MQDYAGAKVDIERWIANLAARSEQDADAFYFLGECFAYLGDADGARAAMRMATTVNPLHTRALRALGAL
jgi:hypothetical protein